MIPRTFFDSRENNFIGKKSALLSGLIALQYISTPTATLMAVITLVLTGQPLTPVNVFTLLYFINLLRSSFCMEMSYGFMVSYDAYVSLKRIRDFLLLDNLDSTNTMIYQQEETEKNIFTSQVTRSTTSNYLRCHKRYSPKAANHPRLRIFAARYRLHG